MRTSAMVRLTIMTALLVGLMVPLTMIYGVVSERTSRRNDAAHAVGREWGAAQVLGGPVLTIPYRHSMRDAAGVAHERTERAFLLPESLAIEGTIESENRNRGLFKVVVYTARLKVRGQFPKPEFSNLRPSATTVDWENATLDLGISDPRGIAQQLVMTLNGQRVTAKPGVTPNGLFSVGVRAPAAGLSSESTLGFEFDLDVKGTERLEFLPSGDETTVRLSSNWPHPGFLGAPQQATVQSSGFTASWRVPYFGRGFSGSWTGEGMQAEIREVQAKAVAFGVNLIRPVDIYVQTERAVKYAVLFIVLTFVVAFLWEVISRRLVHPVQYLFVGFALCIFYLLLLSLAEHIGFDLAYVAAAVSTIGLLSWYWTWVLQGVGQGALMALALTTLYGFLYMLLRLEDYALLAGSVGLFAVLAAVMFLTRRVNWYALRLATPQETDSTRS